MFLSRISKRVIPLCRKCCWPNKSCILSSFMPVQINVGSLYLSHYFNSVTHSWTQLMVMRSMSGSRVEDLINDPRRNLNYDALMIRKKDAPLLIIDVREPAELAETGIISGSINIPLNDVEDALGAMTPEAFHKSYGADKPTKGTLIVFSCRSGRRSRKALAKALALGFLNSSHYEGGWLDWETHLPNKQ